MLSFQEEAKILVCVKDKGYFKEGLDSRFWTEDF